jgi:Carboxypeptidase regulatory-like domain
MFSDLRSPGHISFYRPTKALILVVMSASQLAAQVQTATLTGTVADSSGAVVVGANIQARNLETGAIQSTVSDAQGRYRIPDLSVGTYEVQVSKSGFKSLAQRGITLTVGSLRVLDFSLGVGQTTEVVTVQSDVSQVETRSASVSSLITDTQMRTLPLNGRNVSSLLLMGPGVQLVPQTPAGGGGSATFYGEENNYSVAGSRPAGQAFLLDNSDLQGFFNHGAGSSVTGNSLGVEAIAEFQVLTNTYSAEFGGTGAVMNAVSKSGTNLLHGSAYEFLRNSVLDSKNYFDNPNSHIPSFRRNQFGGSLGGPIKKDRAFFFLNYEGLRQSQGQTGRANVPADYVHRGLLSVPCGGSGQPACDPSTGLAVVGVNPAIAPILALYPLPNAGALPGDRGLFLSVADQTVNEDYVLGRVDFNLSAKDSLFARYVSDRANQKIPFPVALIAGWPEADNTGNQYFTIEERRVARPSLVNSVRFSFVRTNERAHTGGSSSALDLFPGSGRQNAEIEADGNGGLVTPIGANGTVPYFLVQNKFFGGDDVFWTHGAHSLKVGVSIGRVQTNISAPFNVGGNFTFGTLQDFLNGVAASFLGMSAPSPGFSTNRYFREIDFFPYIQDDWRITRRLTLNLGLRYDFATNAVCAGGVPCNAILNPLTSTGFTRVEHVLATNPNTKNFDPRIGLAYDPFSDHKTAIRAGFGIFHEQLAPRTYGPAYYLAPPSGATILVGPGIFPNPYGGFAIPYIAFAGLDYHTDTSPYVMQYNLTIQRELARGMVASVGYIGSSGVHLFSERDQNLPRPCSTAAAPPPFCPPSPSGAPGSVTNPFTGTETNPAFGSLNDDAATSHSSYHSLQASLNRQLSKSIEAQASYTWSKCIDDGSVSYGLEQGAYEVTTPYNQAYDRGRCAFNLAHSFRFNGVYTLPFRGNRVVSGWQVSPILSATTGLPVNVQNGLPIPGQALLGGIEGDRPNYNPNPPSGCHPDQVTKINVGTGVQWYNPQCYSLPSIGTLGNVGRNTVNGPGLLGVDIGVLKDTKITERLDTQFRAEFFNIVNHTNFAPPNPAAGAFAGNVGAPQTYNTNAGLIGNTSTSSRQIQFALKFIF